VRTPEHLDWRKFAVELRVKHTIHAWLVIQQVVNFRVGNQAEQPSLLDNV
jgi:hypothetical protein